MNRPEQEHPYDPGRQRPAYLPPAPPAPVTEPPAARAAPRRGRRLAPLLALIVLVPAWLAFLTWRSADQSYGTDMYAVGTIVPHGAEAEFAGTAWRLTSIAPLPPPGAGSLTEPPPPGGRLVRAYLDVTPHSAAAAKQIYGCTFAGRDDRERVWTAESGTGTDPGVGDDCTAPGLAARHLAPGRTHKVAVTFLVPKDATRSVRPMVRVASRGPYVLFQ